MLFAAAEYGRADIIKSAAKALQEAFPDEDLGRLLGDARSEDGRSLLEVACSADKVDAVS